MQGGRMLNYMAEQARVVRIETVTLKQKLNDLYKCVRAQNSLDSQLAWTTGKFAYLWDIKELALVEQQATVEIPYMWLEELECQLVADNRPYLGRTWN